MTDKEIEEALENHKDIVQRDCSVCPYRNGHRLATYSCNSTQLAKDALDYINRLKSEKQTAKTQLKELLSALYQRTDSEQGFTLYRKDIVELAKDYGIKEEELK